MNQSNAEFSAKAIADVKDFLRRANGTSKLTKGYVSSMLKLVADEAEQCRQGFALSDWHRNERVHAFEALNCRINGTVVRWPQHTLNLHFMGLSDGRLFIASTEEIPLSENYWINRVAADTAFVSAVGD